MSSCHYFFVTLPFWVTSQNPFETEHPQDLPKPHIKTPLGCDKHLYQGKNMHFSGLTLDAKQMLI